MQIDNGKIAFILNTSHLAVESLLYVFIISNWENMM